jgi:hypothetical protein
VISPALRPPVPRRTGQSITNACLVWEKTKAVLANLTDAVRDRRGGVGFLVALSSSSLIRSFSI